MRYLGIDFGRRRTGVALSDETGKFVFPHATWEGWNRQRIIEEIIQTAQNNDVKNIVIGLPLSADGTPSEMENPVRKLVELLREKLTEMNSDIIVHLQDERFSTAVVLGQLREAGVSQRKARQADGNSSTDARAAAVILQNFLDAKAQGEVS